MNKNIDQNKEKPEILLEKNSECYVSYHHFIGSLLKFKGLKTMDHLVYANLNSDSNIKYTMPVFCFIKSPDFDGDQEWHLSYYSGGKPLEETLEYLYYQSYYNFDGRKKLVRTSGLMFMLNIHRMESSQFEKFVSDLKKLDSKTQIKKLEEAGYYKLTAEFNDKCESICKLFVRDKLKFVDEKGNFVNCSDEFYNEPRDYNKKESEYVNPLSKLSIGWAYKFEENKELNSIVILNKNAEMKYYGDNQDESPFCEVNNKNPLQFYCEPGAKVAIDILSKFRDKEKYPEFYNATIVFMSPKLVADYQKNLDDVDNYREMKEFIKSYEANKDYFSFKLSDYSDYSNKRIEQLSHAQTDFSDTWANFVGFMEKIGVKEKSDANKNVDKNDEKKEKENEIGKSEDKNEKGLKNNNKTSTQYVAVDGRGKDDNTGKLNKNNKIRESDDKSRQGLKIGIKPIDEPEENLSGFMRYLKNHWPMIFKFLNAICNFFSRSKNDNNIGLGDTINGEWKTQSLLTKTSRKETEETEKKPNNMENQSVDDVLQ